MQIITTAIQHQNYSQKHRSVGSAIDILNYLRLCLNFSDEKARELSTLLNSLYEYAEKSLLQANLKNDIERVNHAKQVITQIKEGWDAIA
jgi:flagellar protein FliS